MSYKRRNKLDKRSSPSYDKARVMVVSGTYSRSPLHLVQLADPSSYYQLVLLDIRMPRLNGLQLFNTIKTLSPNTKIIFCSALDIAEEVVSISPDIGYNIIIKKPIGENILSVR